MDVEGLLTFIEQYGYVALFFSLWLGIIGMPIPDEVIVMTGGLVASLGYLDPIPTFFVTYLGVISGLMLGYILGRTLGSKALDWLQKKKKNTAKYLEKSYTLIEKYGAYSLCISYFFPIVRHLVPYLMGIGGMSLKRYIFFSFSTGLIWTLLFFLLGKFFGKYINEIGQAVHQYGLIILFIVCVAAAIFIMVLTAKRRKLRG